MIAEPKCRKDRLQRPVVCIFFFYSISAGAALDLRQAKVVAPPNLSGPEKKAVTMLVEEVQRRTGIRWPVSSASPAAGEPLVVLGPSPGLQAFSNDLRAELEDNSGSA